MNTQRTSDFCCFLSSASASDVKLSASRTYQAEFATVDTSLSENRSLSRESLAVKPFDLPITADCLISSLLFEFSTMRIN